MTEIPKPWEIPPGGPFAILERKHGVVTITTIVGPGNKYLVQATGHDDEIVEGHDPANELAHKLADTLDY
jgi:hypothetical protein